MTPTFKIGENVIYTFGRRKGKKGVVVRPYSSFRYLVDVEDVDLPILALDRQLFSVDTLNDACEIML